MGNQENLRELFLDNLDEARKEKDLSLPELSERLGHHRSYLGKVYRENMKITLDLIEGLSEVLDVEPSFFLTDRSRNQ